MADANTRRQRRHDSCLATTRCPRCEAWPRRECHQPIRHNGHVYSRSAFHRAIQHAGMSTGKTMMNTAAVAGMLGRSDWGRQLGGLHKERWAVWEGRSAVERLGELVDG